MDSATFHYSVPAAWRDCLREHPGHWYRQPEPVERLIRVRPVAGGFCATIYHPPRLMPSWTVSPADTTYNFTDVGTGVVGAYPTQGDAMLAAVAVLVAGADRLCSVRDIDKVRKELASK